MPESLPRSCQLFILCFSPFSKKTLAICPKNGRINAKLFNGAFTFLAEIRSKHKYCNYWYRWRMAFTSGTFTLTTSPVFTTWRGSSTNSLKQGICTKPSWQTPMSTAAPKLVTLVTALKSAISSTLSARVAVLNSPRGLRPVFPIL